MSKKHFIKLADYIREFNTLFPSEAFSDHQLHWLAMFCGSQNCAFKEQRWLAYIKGQCGPNGGLKKG